MLWDDSGEAQLVAATGGLMHATGYSVYITIAKLFTFLPFYDEPWRVNFLSAFMGGATLAGIYFLSRALGVRRLFCALGAFVLFIGQLFWSQATISEVYTTSNTFLLGFLTCAVIWGKTRNSNWLLAGGLIGGLCLGLHFMTLLTLPAVLIYLVLYKAEKKDWTSAGAGAFFGIAVALLLYVVLALPDSKTSHINSIRPSMSTYGMKPSDLDSPWAQIEFVMTAREFRSTIFVDRMARLQASGVIYWQKMQSEIGWAGMALAIIGVVGMFVLKRWRREAVLLFLAWAAMLFFVLTYSIVDLEVEFIPTFVLDCVFIAVGLQILQSLILGVRADRPVFRYVAAGVAGAVIVFAGWDNIGGDMQALSDGTPSFLKGDDRIDPFPVDTPLMPHAYASDVMSRVPDGALVITETQVVDNFYYVGMLEQHKQNIDVVERVSFSDHPRMADSLLDYIRQSCNTRPVYVTGLFPELLGRYRFDEIPGSYPLYRIYPAQ